MGDWARGRRRGFSAPPELQAVITVGAAWGSSTNRSTVTSCAVTGRVLGHGRKGWRLPPAETTSCPSALACASLRHAE